MNLLQTHNLSIGYGDKALSKDLNLRIPEGKLIGLIGQNGVGKSTLLRTLCGFQRPLSGKIELSGENLNSMNRREQAKKLAVVLTEKPGAQNLTVLELISLGRHPYSGWLGQMDAEDMVAMERAIEQCEIHYLLEKRLYQLSDGQLQKVMIARALVQGTDLILLDEPTSHLDLRNKSEVLDTLKSITKNGKSILISTHEISLSSKVCDEFWLMDFMKPMEVGEPTRLLESGRVTDVLHLKQGVL